MSSGSKAYFRKASSFIWKFISDSSTEDFIRRQRTNVHVRTGTASFNRFLGTEGEDQQEARPVQWQYEHEHPGPQPRYQNSARRAILFLESLTPPTGTPNRPFVPPP